MQEVGLVVDKFGITSGGDPKLVQRTKPSPSPPSSDFFTAAPHRDCALLHHDAVNVLNRFSTMHMRFSSETPSNDGDNQFPPSPPGFLDMMFGESEGGDIAAGFTETETTKQDTLQEKEPEAPPKKRSRVSNQKGKTKKKGASSSKKTTTNGGDTSDEEEGNKRGPTWKEHWVVNLIHLRGTMHDKFRGMKKQGVDNWGVLHTHLVAACPDFDRSSDACRKKWKKIYDDYKSDYTANGISGNDRSTKCKWYPIIDGYMHDRANVLKHVYASTNDEDPNGLQAEGEDTLADNVIVPEPTASSSQTPVWKKNDKLATQEAIIIMAEQSTKLADVVKESEAAKLTLLQAMVATMNELVNKL